jgi:hypothetical protein
MDASQSTRSGPAVHDIRRHTRVQQLTARHNPVLTRGGGCYCRFDFDG